MSTMSPEPLPYAEAVELLFPNRQAVLSRWTDQLRPHIDTTVVVDNVTAKDVGSIIELCIGFDLADTVPYLDALALLNPTDSTELLTAAGFTPLHSNGLRAGLIDPASWHRPVHTSMDMSIVMPGSVQLAQIYKIQHDLPIDRAWCELFLNGCRRTPLAGPVHDDVTDLWNLYTTRGRDQILALASGPVTARPVFHKDAPGDLIIGPVLFDIKAVTNPLNDLDTHLCQLLGYVLFDQNDQYGLHTVALYYARQAITVSLDLRDELTHLTGQTHPSLPDLRTRFAHLTHLTDPHHR